MAEHKAYGPEVYLVAAVGHAIMTSDAAFVKSINTYEDVAALFNESFGEKITPDLAEKAIKFAADLELLSLDVDPFAGDHISIQKTGFATRFKEVAVQVPDSPIDIVTRGGEAWLKRVFANPAFWEQVDGEKGPTSRPKKTAFDEVPASDRHVTLLHNSPERAEIEEMLSSISEEVRSNNAIAAELGEERDRLTAEINAAQAIIKPERIRAANIRDLLLRTLGELASKLKEKAIDLGVDRLIVLLEIILNQVS